MVVAPPGRLMSRKLPSLTDFRRIVVKVGSSLLVDREGGRLQQDWLAALAEDLAALHREKRDVLVVSSGAIALGRAVLRLPAGPLKLEDSQAAAAVGQIALARTWAEVLGRHAITAGQVLVTLQDTEERRRYLNARSTIDKLLEWRAVPVINENDTVATTEIRFGDNDRLAARVAAMIAADALVLLSDIDGLYTADPKLDGEAAHIPEIAELTPEIEAMAGEALPGYSSGGMVTKLAAARIAIGAGCRMAIADGRRINPLAAIAEGARCSWFLPAGSPRSARKKWIAGALKPVGSLIVDDGALKALAGGKSLLPAGVIAVEGSFDRGDAVRVLDRAGRQVARGLSAYSASDAQRIMGHKSREIETLLGYRGRDEMVHRDDLVVER